MDKANIYEFLKQHKLAVVSTISGYNKPESAVIGIAVSPKLEVVFDTLKTSRKYENIMQNPSVALVIGWDDEITVQYEGVATELTGAEDDRYREIYYEAYPGGRERAATWPGLVHFKLEPTWLRYSNFNEPVVVRWCFDMQMCRCANLQMKRRRYFFLR